MRETRLHAVVAALPLTVWTLFHLAEQWAAFGGSEAWLAQMRRTSRGALPLFLEVVLVVGPLVLWAVLAIRAALRREPAPSALREDDGAGGAILARLAPAAAVVTLVLTFAHVAALWAPKVLRGASEVEAWSWLTHDLGRPVWLVLHAVFLSALGVHLAASIPAALLALGFVTTDSSRRGTVLVAAVLGLCVFVLAAQLTGWVATGQGTFWPIEVIEVPAAR